MANIRYVNHNGQSVTFGIRPYYIKETDIRNFSWDSVNNGLKIIKINRLSGITNKKATIFVYGTSAEEAAAQKNALYEIFDADAANMQYGRLYVGDYYLKCYVIGAEKTEYNGNPLTITIEIAIITDTPVWYKEVLYTFSKNAPLLPASYDKQYPHDYPYGFMTAYTSSTINNTSNADCGFSMRIYGPCISPSVLINDHIYTAAVYLGTGESLAITSSGADRYVYQYSVIGEGRNVFNLRSKTSDIFQKITPGAGTVSWARSFDFDLTLLLERGEPLWI